MHPRQSTGSLAGFIEAKAALAVPHRGWVGWYEDDTGVYEGYELSFWEAIR
jgi:hypothetical protein